MNAETLERESLLAVNGSMQTPCDLGGWSVAICPSCGAQVNEWLTHDGPDVIEHEQCPMCAEADRDEEWWL